MRLPSTRPESNGIWTYLILTWCDQHLDFSNLEHLSMYLSLELVRLSHISIWLLIVSIEVFGFTVSLSQQFIVVEQSIADIQNFTYPAPSGIFMSVPGSMSFRLPSNSTKKFSKSFNIRFPSFSSSNVKVDVVSFSSNNFSPPIRRTRKLYNSLVGFEL